MRIVSSPELAAKKKKKAKNSTTPYIAERDYVMTHQCLLRSGC